MLIWWLKVLLSLESKYFFVPNSDNDFHQTLNKNVSKLQAIIFGIIEHPLWLPMYIWISLKTDLNHIAHISDVYLGSCHTYIMESFGKIVNGKNFHRRYKTVPKKCLWIYIFVFLSLIWILRCWSGKLKFYHYF